MAKSRQPNGASSIYLGKDGNWHGYVTVGVKDNGKSDRRHVKRKTRADVTKAVRALEKQRDAGSVRKAGPAWTVESWLTHLVENIAALHVSENTIDGYRVAVYHHILPGLGAHRLTKLEPEHLERFYKKMQDNGSSAGTAHQVHRTVRAALNEAKRRRHLTKNPASIAKAPRVEEGEVVPYTVKEVQLLLEVANRQRNAARWVIALALGLRQGEVSRAQVDGRRLRPRGPGRPPGAAAAQVPARLRRPLRAQARLLPAEGQRPAGDQGHQVPCRTSAHRRPRRADEAPRAAPGPTGPRAPPRP